MSRGYAQIEFQFPNAKNGSFFVYVAGGTFTDYADVYDPISGAVLAQPLTIDSNGYVQGFHIDSAINYDILVKDYNGAVKFTRQNASVIGGGSSTPGPQGPEGDKGDTGATGPQGPAGVDGQDGVDGTDGIDGQDGQDGDGLYQIFISDESTGEISYSKTSNPTISYIAGSLFPTGVGQVKVTAVDSLGYLSDKITAGNGISVSASNFDVTITNDLPETYKVKANAVGIEDYLGSVLQAGTGISLQLSPDLSKIQIIATGDATGGWVWQGLWSSATTYAANDAVNYYDASGIPVINRVYVATSATSANPYTDGTGWFLAFSIDTAGDQFVKLDATDVLNGYMLDKIKAGNGISFTRTDTSAGSYVHVNATVSALSVAADGTGYSIGTMGDVIEFLPGTNIEPKWDGTKLKFNHTAAGTSAVSAYKPTFDSFGHYTGDLGPLTINEITGLTSALSVAGDSKVKVNAETTKGYLNDVLEVGIGITKTTSGDQLILTAEGSTKVRVNAADTNPDYLASKVIGSENISVTTSANNVLVISAAGAFDTYKVKSTSGDTSADYLANKVVAGDNISLSLIPYGDGEALEINLSLSGSDDSELIAGRLSVYEHTMLKTSYIAESLTQYLGGSMFDWSMTLTELSSGFAANFDEFTGIFEIEKDGMYLISYGFCPFLREYTVGLPWSTDSAFSTHIYESYDNFATSTAVVNGQFDLVRTSTFGDIHSMSWCGQIKQVQDNLGRWKKFRIGVTLQNTSSIVAATFRNSYINVTEVRKPIAIQGPKGDKGDPGDSGVAAIYGYGNIVTTSATSGVDITTTPNLSATYLTLNGGLTSAASVGTIEYDSITDAFWITTSV